MNEELRPLTLEDIDFALVELEKLNLVEKFIKNGKEMWKLVKS